MVLQKISLFNAYEKFETFQRSKEMTISDFINEFEQLNEKLKSFKIELPSVVLAYQLLKSANLPKSTRDLARATCLSLTYNDMKKQIKAIYDQCGQADKSNDNDTKIEIEDTFYGKTFDRRRTQNFNPGRRERQGSGSYKTSSSKSRQNPTGADGHQLQCHLCKSIMHLMKDCPDKETLSKTSGSVHVQFFADGVEQCFMEQVVSESLNCAVHQQFVVLIG